MPVLPTHYLDAVTSIGLPTPEGGFLPLASGFFLGKLSETGIDDSENQYFGYMVTNRHVLEGREFVALRINRIADKPSNLYILQRFDQDGRDRWHFHPNEEIDIAIVDIRSRHFVEDEIDFNFFKDDETYLMKEDFIELGISEGDFVYTLGFPMGLAGEERNYTIVRTGSISRISDYLRGASTTFMIDCFVFPGNSGGPVVLRPALASIDKKPVARAHLLGVVSSYLPYTDTAISLQTGLERISFQENSGLAVVYPVEYIEATIASYISQPGD